MLRKIPVLTVLVVLVFACNNKKTNQKSDTGGTIEKTEEKVVHETDLPLSNLNLPPGFKIQVFAEGLDGARSMAMGDNGTLFVGTRNENTIYALQDLDK